MYGWWEIITALFYHTVMIEGGGGGGGYGTNIDVDRHWGKTRNKITSEPSDLTPRRRVQLSEPEDLLSKRALHYANLSLEEG